MAQKSFIRRAADSIISGLGYYPITKAESGVAGHYKSMAINPYSRFGTKNLESVLKNGMKKPGKISFKLLREVAKRDAIIRICVNVIKKAVSQAEWEIVIKETAPGDPDSYNTEKEVVYELFEYMNHNGENMRILLDRVLEDLLILDAGVLEKVKTLDGKDLVALNSVDGATIRPVYNERGEFGTPYAYKQIMNDKVSAEFFQDEIIYMMANPQNDVDLFGYGLSPIESILLQVQAALEADLYNIKSFSKDNIPPGMLDLGDMTAEEAEQFIAMWNATVIGNTHGMKFVWGSDNPKKWIDFKGSNKDMQFAEYIDWLSRIKLAVYGLSSIDANMLQDVNRATAEVQQQISDSRGVRSTKALVEEYFTRQIIRELGGDVMDKNNKYRHLEFKFKKAEDLLAKKTQAEIDEKYIDKGVIGADEVREREGYKPRPELHAVDEDIESSLREAEKEAAKKEKGKPLYS